VEQFSFLTASEPHFMPDISYKAGKLKSSPEQRKTLHFYAGFLTAACTKENKLHELL